MIKNTPNLTHVSQRDGPMKYHERFMRESEEYDIFQFIAMFHSDFSYIVHGDMYEEMAAKPRLNRLRGVRQLGIVGNGSSFFASQNRYYHSLITAVLSELVLANNKFSESDMNLGIISGLLHDLAIPVLSDQGKLASRADLDEEENLPLILSGGEFDDVFRKYNVKRDDVIRCVKGEYPKIGPLLNSKGIDIDKIAYVGVDFPLAIELSRVPYVISDDLFDIYNDIRFLDDDIYFTEPERVAEFLKVRADMWERVYFLQRAENAFIKRELTRAWKNGDINKQMMLKMTDEEFGKMFSKMSDIYPKFFSLFPYFEEVARFYNRSVEDVREEYGDGFAVEQWQGFNPATTTKIRVDKKIRQFGNVYPDIAHDIQTSSDRCRYVGVYRMKND